MSVFAKLLPQILPDLKDKVFDYSARVDFEKLWKFAGLPEKRIVIVWTQTAPDPALAPINAADCLSPLDWAAAYVKHLSSSPESWPQILVIDANPQSHLGVPTLAHFNTLRPEQLPCLTVLNHPNLADLLNWLETKNQTGNIPALDRFLRELRLNLTDVRSVGDYDRHSISNIVGPMVLLGGSVAESRHAAALEELLKASKMVSSKCLESKVARSENFNVALIDDQAEHGWKKWVQSRLDPETCSVVSTSSPERFVEFMMDHKGSDFRFQIGPALFSSTKEKGTRLPVLLLDLRLFSGDPDAERRFFRETLLPTINKKYLASTARSVPMPWPGFDEQNGSAFQRARETLEDGAAYASESAEHLEMLTWLPRMLALADMTLPIVIFSSTGRRTIVEKFAPYGNIITCFEKPRFFGEDSSTIRESTEKAFADALDQARDIARAAQQIRTVLDLRLEGFEATKEAFKDKKRIEIFHDECMSPNNDLFRVAGFAVGFPDKDSADKTDQHIENHGPRFFGANALDKETRQAEGETQWNDKIAETLKAALNAGGSRAAQFLPFVIVSGENFAPHAQDGDSFSLVDPTGMDNVNQELLRLLLEVMLCDTLAWIASDDLESCHVFGATRMRAIKWPEGTPDTSDIAKELSSRWRIDVSGKVHADQSENGDFWVKWPSLRPDSFFGLLNELFAARSANKKAHQLGRKVTSAYGTTLPQKNDTRAWPGYSYLHSIADIVARLVDVDPENSKVTWNCLETNADLPLKTRGAAAIRSRIVNIINCHRALDESDLADGFGYGLMVDHLHDLAGNVVAYRLKKMVPELSGSDFLKIVHHVKNEGPSWTHSIRVSDTMGGKKRKVERERAEHLKPTAINKPGAKGPKTAPSAPKKEKRMLEGTLCINGLPKMDSCSNEAIESALKSVEITGKIVRLITSKAGRVALVEVGSYMEDLLARYSDGIILFDQKCSVTQAFEMTAVRDGTTNDDQSASN